MAPSTVTKGRGEAYDINHNKTFAPVTTEQTTLADYDEWVTYTLDGH